MIAYVQEISEKYKKTLMMAYEKQNLDGRNQNFLLFIVWPSVSELFTLKKY